MRACQFIGGQDFTLTDHSPGKVELGQSQRQANGGHVGQPEPAAFQLSPTDPAWSPKSSPVVVATSDVEVVIALSDEDAAAYERAFTNLGVYLTTSDGWMVDEKGRGVLPIPDYSVIVTRTR